MAFMADPDLMPGMSGVEVLTHIRQKYKPNEITVIMISSNNNDSTIDQCILHGADSYMLKPASSKEVAALWQFVARRQQQQHKVERKENDLLECIHIIEESIGHSAVDAGRPHAERQSPKGSTRREPLAARGAKERRRKQKDGLPHPQLQRDLQADLRAAQLYSLGDFNSLSVTESDTAVVARHGRNNSNRL